MPATRKPLCLVTTCLGAWILTLGLGARATPADPEARASAEPPGRPAGAAAGERRRAAAMEAVLASLDACPGGDCASAARREALDRLCGVRDCAEIRLFWYTDLDAAQAAARESGKPILSLRLLGRLDEEFSCANSRFFRTVLYGNREIGDLLRERFVLHWRSVRPVPRVTIDFGDGTTLERTLTGNSIHYLLDAHGRLIDALPGLYGPEAFRRALLEGEQAAREAGRLEDPRFRSWIARRHRSELSEGVAILLSELEASGAVPDPALATAGDLVIPQSFALETRSKSMVEAPLTAALVPAVSDDQLRRLAELRRPAVRLDEASRAFLLRKHGVGADTAADGERLIAAFEESIALDQAINELRLRPAILARLADPSFPPAPDLEAFNDWVYRAVFNTPLADPWMGLAPAEVYAALPASSRRGAVPTMPAPPPPEPILPGG